MHSIRYKAYILCYKIDKPKKKKFELKAFIE